MTAARDPVSVKTLSFNQLLVASEWPLALDSYQRGFVWDKPKMTQLASDLAEYQKKSRQSLPYYMGTLLLHADDKKQLRFIIDGQQRITALSVLHRQLTGSLPKRQALSYSAHSSRFIRQAAKALAECAELPDTSVFDRLLFTVIVVDSADQAFTFFDTQNNRGVRLHATDLLKAFHLRAIDQAGGHERQRHGLEQYCAERWEDIQRHPAVLSPGQDFAPNLFNRFLWRARRWRGSQVPNGRHDSILGEFQTNTWPLGYDARSSLDTLPVYACRHNRMATTLTLKADGERELQGSRLLLSQNPANLPMALRQPIHQGIGFFLFADKYAALLQSLMNEPTAEVRLLAFRSLYTQLLRSNQEYLREIFLLASLLYVDQFDYEQLMAFALRLEFLLGAIRLDKQQVRQETAANFFRDGDLNLLDVIAQSHHPRQVLEYLYQQQRQCAEPYRDEQVVIGKGVQGRYKQAVLNYFHPEAGMGCERLADKPSWVESVIKRDWS